MTVAACTTLARVAIRFRRIGWDDGLALVGLFSLAVTAVVGSMFYKLDGKPCQNLVISLILMRHAIRAKYYAPRLPGSFVLHLNGYLQLHRLVCLIAINLPYVTHHGLYKS